MNQPKEETIDFQPTSKRVCLGDNENHIHSNNSNNMDGEVLNETIISVETHNERQSNDMETNPNGNFL